MTQNSMLLAAMLAGACATPEKPPPPKTYDAALCGPPIDGADEIKDGSLLVFGELHGLEAPPAFAADLACRIASRGGSVCLAVEIPKQEQSAIETYLAAPQPRRNALLASPFWTRTDQDGRSSEARFQMLEGVRAMRQRGLHIRVTAFDDSAVTVQQARETAMADNIIASRAVDETTIALVGNLHARTVSGAPWDPNIVWMSATIREHEPRVLTFDNRYLEGTAWTCEGPPPSECKVHLVRGKGQGDEWRIERFDAPSREGYDGDFQLGKAVASPPAIGVPAPTPHR